MILYVQCTCVACVLAHITGIGTRGAGGGGGGGCSPPVNFTWGAKPHFEITNLQW